jgi:hypothetical protein
MSKSGMIHSTVLLFFSLVAPRVQAKVTCSNATLEGKYVVSGIGDVNPANPQSVILVGYINLSQRPSPEGGGL